MFKSGIKIEKLSEENILRVGLKAKSAELIETFYEKMPFPNFDGFETIDDIHAKVRENKFTSSLKKSVGWGKKIIEVGSGTSQLSIALASRTNNEVVAFDATLESLRLGATFAKKHEIDNCIFVNGDLNSDPFVSGYFDVVWCSGVLHHTDCAEKGFKIIQEWVRPGGYIVIGLYNSYGRARTVFRQLLYKFLGKSRFGGALVRLLDPVLRQLKSRLKNEAWFRDQYEHPCESLHTIDEVLQWFDLTGFEFVGSLPTCDLKPYDYENMFTKKSRENRFTRFLSQILMLFSLSGSEGGLFLMLGKKKTR